MKRLLVFALLLSALPVLGQEHPFGNFDDYTTIGGPTGWTQCSGACAGGATPATTSQTFNNATPALDGGSMLLSESGPTVTGAQGANNGWYLYNGIHDADTAFVLDFWINTASLNNVQSREFDQFQYLLTGSSGVLQNTRFYFGTQCVTGANWQVWDSYGNAWQDTGAACNIPASGFHHIVETAHRVVGDTSCSHSYPCMHYDSIVVDGVVTVSNVTTNAGALPNGWTENTGFMLQLDAIPSCGSACTISSSFDEATFSSYPLGSCGPPTYLCSNATSTVIQTPAPPAALIGTAGINQVGYDISLNPAGTNPITRLTDSTVLLSLSGLPNTPAPTPSQGDNDLAANCAQRGTTPGSTFTTTACQNATTYLIALTVGGCPYVEGVQKINSQVQVVAPPQTTVGAAFHPTTCGNLSFSHTDPWTSYSVPASTTSPPAPIIYKTVWAWDGTVGHTLTWTQTSLYNLQTLCPLPGSFGTRWASSVSTDLTDSYFVVGLSSTGGQNTGSYVVQLDTTSTPATCVVYNTNAGTQSCSAGGPNCPGGSFAPACTFYVHDVFAMQSAGVIPISTSGGSCTTNKPMWQPYGPVLSQCSLTGTIGGLVCGGGHYSTGYSNFSILNNPYIFNFPAAHATAASTTTTSAVLIGSGNVLSVTSTANMYVGQPLCIDAGNAACTGTNQEIVVVATIPPQVGGGSCISFGYTPPCFTATFAKNHLNPGITVTSAPLPPFNQVSPGVYALNGNCENHFSNQNANTANSNPVIGASANNNFSLSGLVSSWTAAGQNEVYAIFPVANGAQAAGTLVRFAHTWSLGPGNGVGCGNSNVGPFDNTNTNFSQAYSIFDVTQDGSIGWWASSMLGMLGTDVNNQFKGDIFAVCLDCVAGTGQQILQGNWWLTGGISLQ